MKAILIAMLMNATTGDITEIRKPEPFKTEKDCRDAAKLLSSALDGYVVRAYCLVPGEMQ